MYAAVVRLAESCSAEAVSSAAAAAASIRTTHHIRIPQTWSLPWSQSIGNRRLPIRSKVWRALFTFSFPYLRFRCLLARKELSQNSGKTARPVYSVGYILRCGYSISLEPRYITSLVSQYLSLSTLGLNVGLMAIRTKQRMECRKCGLLITDLRRLCRSSDIQYGF